MQLLAVPELPEGVDGNVWSQRIIVLSTSGKAVVPVQQVSGAVVSGEKTCHIIHTTSR